MTTIYNKPTIWTPTQQYRIKKYVGGMSKKVSISATVFILLCVIAVSLFFIFA